MAEVPLVRAGRARWQPGGDLLANEEMKGARASRERRREAEVGDHELAAEIGRRRQHVRRLEGHEGYRVTRRQHRPVRARAIGVEAARQVDRHAHRSPPRQRFHALGRRPVQRTGQSGPKERVDKQRRVPEVAIRRARFELPDLEADPPADLQLQGAVRRKLPAEPIEAERHFETARREVTSDGEAIPAVVAWATDHGNTSLLRERRGQRLDHGERGVLHQHRSRHPQLFDRPPIEVARLRRGQDSHPTLRT